MAKITIKGRIGKIEHIETGSSPRVKFSVAEGIPPQNGSNDWGTQWYECTAWQKTKERMRNAEKGQMVLVEGSFSAKEYEGKTYLNVSVFNVEFLADPRKQTVRNDTPSFNTGDIPF